jgi:hypothetical protein
MARGIILYPPSMGAALRIISTRILRTIIVSSCRFLEASMLSMDVKFGIILKVYYCQSFIRYKVNKFEIWLFFDSLKSINL